MIFGLVVGETDLAVDVAGAVVFVVFVEGGETSCGAEGAAGMSGYHMLVLLLEGYSFEWT